MKKNFMNSLSVYLLPALAAWLIRIIWATVRVTYVNDGGYRRLSAQGAQVLLAFWHGRLILAPYGYLGKTGFTVLVSEHRDGELVARWASRFGISSVRGSTTKGWFAGLKGMLQTARSGGDIAITPDGPKGPRAKAQMGVVQLARATGLPVIPMTFGASRTKTFGSWDAFTLPYPFARCVFVYGDAIKVAKDVDERGMEDARVRIERELNRITELADGYFS